MAWLNGYDAVCEMAWLNGYDAVCEMVWLNGYDAVCVWDETISLFVDMVQYFSV